MGDRYDPFSSPFDLLDDHYGDHFGHNSDDDHHDPYRRNETRIRRAVEKDLLRLERTPHCDELRRLAESVLGHDAFSLGVTAGIARKIGRDVAGLYDLARVFVLADVYERFCTASGSMACRHDDHGWSRGHHLVRLGPWDGPLHLFHEVEAAAKQRDAIVAELKAIMDDPVAFAKLLPKRMQDEYGPEWRRFVVLRSESRLSSQFAAGMIFSELLADVVMLVAGLVATAYGVVAVVDGVGQLGAKLPSLMRFIRGARGGASRLGRVGESFEAAAASESTAIGESAAAGDRAAATVPRETPAAKPVAPKKPPLPLDGISEGQRALAEADTVEGLPEVAALQKDARRRVAAQFLRQHGGMSEVDAPSHINAIDLSKPVRVGPPPPLAEVQAQWRIPGRFPGRYYSDVNSPPDKLGILQRGNTSAGEPVYPRVLEEYKINPEAPYMESTTSDVTDNFSIVGEEHPVKGGAVQRFITRGNVRTTPVYQEQFPVEKLDMLKVYQ